GGMGSSLSIGLAPGGRAVPKAVAPPAAAAATEAAVGVLSGLVRAFFKEGNGVEAPPPTPPPIDERCGGDARGVEGDAKVSAANEAGVPVPASANALAFSFFANTRAMYA